MRSPPTRRLRRILPLAILLLIALASFTWLDNAINRGITYTPTAPPITWTDVPQLGVNAFNIQYEPDPANVSRTLTLARDLGAHYVRIQMPWEDIEIAGKGDFIDRRNPQNIHSAWDKYDFIVAEATRLQLELIVRLDRPPRWARAIADQTPAFQAGLKINSDSSGPPDTTADYADYVTAVASRYRAQIRFFQLWNEPNLTYEWNWRTPSPEAFVTLLQAGYHAAKNANPAALILFPSLSPTDGKDAQAPMTELEYLDRIYQAGGGHYFDIMAAQAYGLGQPPDEHRYVNLRWNPAHPLQHLDRPLDTRTDVSRIVLLREIMERHGDSGKAIWISEFGYNSAPDSVPEPGRSTWGPPVSETQKGDYIVGQLRRAQREWPWIGVMNIWFLRWSGAAPDPHNPTAYFAIINHDFTPLPAYTTIKTYTSAPPTAGIGAHTWHHPSVTQRPDGQWTIPFTGQSLALLGGSGTAHITIDTMQPRSLTLTNTTTLVADNLTDTPHTALIQTTDTPPEGFIIGRTPPYPWIWTLVPTILLSLLAIIGAQATHLLFQRIAP